MIPIEVFTLTLWIGFGMVGLVRKFPRELGATIGLVAMLLMFAILGDRVGGLTFRISTMLGATWTEDMVKWCFYTGLIWTWVFFMYAGQTFTFSGIWPPSRLLGFLTDSVIGLFNGWLVIGTWWYYTDKLGYPISRFGLYTPPPSAWAQQLVTMTPMAILPASQAVLFLGMALVGLIALRVYR